MAGACEHMSSRTIWSQSAVLCLQHTVLILPLAVSFSHSSRMCSFSTRSELGDVWQVGVNTVVAVAPALAAKHATEQQLLDACPQCCSRVWSSFFPMCEAWQKIVAAGTPLVE